MQLKRRKNQSRAYLHDDDDSVPKINAIQNCKNFSHRALNENLCWLTGMVIQGVEF